MREGVKRVRRMERRRERETEGRRDGGKEIKNTNKKSLSGILTRILYYKPDYKIIA